MLLSGCSDPPSLAFPPPAQAQSFLASAPTIQPASKVDPAPPFELETSLGTKTDFLKTIPPLQPAPQIDPDALFHLIESCYPGKSKFDISVKMRAGVNLLENTPINLDESTLDPLSSYYVGIVANMPLWDNSEETDRQRTREYQRRTRVAKDIADFIQAIAERNTAARKLGLYLALEQRSQQRIRLALASVTEQVGYMEKVISTKEKLIESRAEITEAKLALSGQCRADVKDQVNNYLTGLAEERPAK